MSTSVPGPSAKGRSVRNSPRRIAVNGVNTLLGLADMKLVRSREQDWADPRTFIPFKETIESAARAGMPVGRYIDATYNVPGSNEETIEELRKLGVLDHEVDRVCELGPGSGRYLERVKEISDPGHYEIYETAVPWANWLVETYGVTKRPTDGTTLASTASSSIDLVHAHKVMCVLPFLTICRYLVEMMRVTRPGGLVVFDALTEECMDVDAVRAWVESDVGSGPYPSFLAKQLVLDNFAIRGFELIGTFLVPLKPGRTQYFVFRRR